MTPKYAGDEGVFRTELQRTIVPHIQVGFDVGSKRISQSILERGAGAVSTGDSPRFFDVQSQCSRGVSDPRDGPGVRVAYQEGGRSRHGCSTVPRPGAAKNAAQGDATVALGASQLTERDGLRDCAGAPSEA